MAEQHRVAHHPVLGATPDGQPISFTFDGRDIHGRRGDTIASALWAVGLTVLGQGAGGDPRGLYCGIGHCFSCRVTVDGVRGVRACLVLIRPGMRVERCVEDGDANAR